MAFNSRKLLEKYLSYGTLAGSCSEFGLGKQVDTELDGQQRSEWDAPRQGSYATIITENVGGGEVRTYCIVYTINMYIFVFV